MKNVNLTDLRMLLERASPEDRANFSKIINSRFGDSPQHLCDHLHYCRAGFVGQHFDRRDYKQLVTDVADYVGVDWPGLLKDRSWEKIEASEIEDAVMLKVFQKVFEQLSDEDRRKLAEELGRAGKSPNIIGEILTGGALVLGQLTRFQAYLLATTTVGALTSALGITLPFVIYTALTRTISIILGPIGWAFLGISVILHLNRPNWSRLVPAIIYISFVRHKLDADPQTSNKA